MAIDVNELLAPIPGSDPAGSDASFSDQFANVATSAFYDDISVSDLPFGDGFEGGNTQAWHMTVP